MPQCTAQTNAGAQYRAWALHGAVHCLAHLGLIGGATPGGGRKTQRQRDLDAARQEAREGFHGTAARLAPRARVVLEEALWAEYPGAGGRLVADHEARLRAAAIVLDLARA